MTLQVRKAIMVKCKQKCVYQGQNEGRIFTCIKNRKGEVQRFNRQCRIIKWYPVTVIGGSAPKEWAKQSQPVPGCSGNGTAWITHPHTEAGTEEFPGSSVKLLPSEPSQYPYVGPYKIEDYTYKQTRAPLTGKGGLDRHWFNSADLLWQEPTGW